MSWAGNCVGHEGFWWCSWLGCVDGFDKQARRYGRDGEEYGWCVFATRWERVVMQS